MLIPQGKIEHGQIKLTLFETKNLSKRKIESYKDAKKNKNKEL